MADYAFRKQPWVSEVVAWEGTLPRSRWGRVWRFTWWPANTWAWEVGTHPGPTGYIATGNRRSVRAAKRAAWLRAWGREWRER